MDNQSIKNMMQAQGMNISDEQINMMKNGEFIKNAHKQMRNNPQMFENYKTQMKNSNINTNSNTNSDKSTSINPSTRNCCDHSHSQETQNNNHNQAPPQFPDMSNFPKNMDMSSMMDFISKNPDMLKMISPQLAKMFGNSKNGEIPPEMQTIMYILGMPQKIKKWFTSPKGLLISGLAGYFIYNYFWGK